jgi:hypothetical protein
MIALQIGLRRAQSQINLKMPDYKKAPPVLTFMTTNVHNHLIGAAFLLWRAVFLADAGRSPNEVHQSQTQFHNVEFVSGIIACDPAGG